MSDSELVCCFTGHRSAQLPWKYNESGERFSIFRENLKQAIIDSINLGYNHFISGMALGADMIAAELVLELKKIYPNLILECALPCTDQTLKWKEECATRYEHILSLADKVTFVSKCEHVDGCMAKRNKYMIDNSSRVIAVYNGRKSGGTFQTINMAKSANKELIIVNPAL